jgi:hypothetical protein
MSITAIIIIFIFIIGPVSRAVVAIQEQEMLEKALDSYEEPGIHVGWDLPNKIAIIYDPSDISLTKTALSVFSSVNLIYSNTELLPVTTFRQLLGYIGEDKYHIKSYFIKGTIKGISINEKIHTWDKFANYALLDRNSHHIFGAGSTDQLRKYITPTLSNFHIEGSDIIDAQLSFIYNLWEIGDILAGEKSIYHEVANDFRELGSIYFAENMNDLMNAQVNPQNPLGEEDKEKKMQEYNNTLDGYKEIYQVLPDGSKRQLNETGVVPKTSLYLMDDETDKVYVAPDEYFLQSEAKRHSSKSMALVKEEMPFSISDIPLFSGLEGPTAGIIDTILDVLIRFGGKKLGVDPDVIYFIIEVVMEISALLGSDESGSEDSQGTLKSMIINILKIAPIPETLKPFIPVIVDAIFLGINGGKIVDIVSFVKSTLSAIFTSAGTLFNSSTMDTVFTVLEAVLLNSVDLTVRLIEDKDEAESTGETFEPMTSVSSFVFEKLLNFTAFEWLADVMGGADNEVLQETGQLMKIGIPLVKALVTGDMNELFEALPEVAEYLIDKLSPSISIVLSEKQKSSIKTIARFFQLVMIFYDNFNDNGGSMESFTSGNLEDLLFLLVQSALPMITSSGLSSGSESSSTITELVAGVFDAYEDASINNIESQSTLMRNIKDLMVTAGLGSTTESDLIADFLAILGSIAVSTIPLPKASDFRRISGSLIDLVTQNTNFGVDFGNKTKDTLFLAIDMIFGILAMTGTGTAAQFLFIDDLSTLRDDIEVDSDSDDESDPSDETPSLDTAVVQKKLVKYIKNQTVNLVTIFVSDYIDESNRPLIPIFSDMLFTIGPAILSGDGDAIKTTIQAVLMQATAILISNTLGVDGNIAIKVIQSLFNSVVGRNTLTGTAEEDEVKSEDIKLLVKSGLDSRDVPTTSPLRPLANAGIDFLFGVKDLFTDGLEWIFNKLKTFLVAQLAVLLDSWQERLNDYLARSPILNFVGGIPFKGADALGVQFTFELSINLNLHIKTKEFIAWVFNLIFKGSEDLDLDIGEFFKKLFSFIEFAPVFTASLDVGTMSSGKGGMTKFLLESLPVTITVSGSAWFSIKIASFSGGGFQAEESMKILGWGFGITFTISKDFTVLDIAAGPAAGGALGKLARYIGLDAIVVTVYFRFGMEIFWNAGQGCAPAQSQLSLTFAIGMALTTGFDLVILTAKLTLGLEVSITFTQDLLNLGAPLQITLDLIFYAKVELVFFLSEWEKRWEYRPSGFPMDLSPKSGTEELKGMALGFDQDGDGISDLTELISPILDPFNPDTDGDGLSDKCEVYISLTDPSIADTDGDGVSDFAEWVVHKTDPFRKDTDYDKLSDWEELFKYQTDPFSDDTDGDLLSDYYEVTHALNMTFIDPSVKFIVVGTEIFTDRTNPNDPDTDDDGLLDGEEDIFGAWYGDPINYYSDDESNAESTTEDTNGDGIPDPTDVNETNLINTGANSSTGLMSGNITANGLPQCIEDSTCNVDPMLIYNSGYTHPLDNDTDDDSYWQYYDGTAYYDGEGNKRYWGDLSDGAETSGIVATIIEYDAVRGVNVFVTKTFYTNPTNPDSDGDSAVCRDGLFHTNGTTQRGETDPGLPWGMDNPCSREWGLPDGIHPNNYMNGDGRELFEVFTNPLNADSDGDSLVDGLEGTSIFPRGFTTNPFKPDTDGDSLPDGLEFVIGTLPDNPDTDGDLVLDGDEFYIFNTNPLLSDTDLDGVSDGWELFFSHSNPHSRDSDRDGLDDYQELYVYASDPMDEDSDNDDLTDREEVFIYETDPSNSDTDGDGLRDGEEILIYRTNPFNEDSDGDSILYLNEIGEPTFLWNDGMEVEYGTDPNSMDTDFDGILDSWELYIAVGNIPNFENIQVDPLNNDTDGDGFLDGQEMLVNETRSLIYPYVAYDTFFPYSSSPTSADTDNDGLDDLYEYNKGINPNATDTDNDNLTDWDEIFIHLTDPSQEDTDGDGIIDSEEVTSAVETTTPNLLKLRKKLVTSTAATQLSDYDPTYLTSATEPDSDGDGWPDGLEVNGTDGDPRYDPYDSDVNRNGVPDGYERDYDFDGIADGDEYYRYQSTGDDEGGFLDYRNPDSDFDGLIDGEEILVYGTKPFMADTDEDGFSDSLELFLGTNPLEFTPEHIFLDIVNRKTTPLVMVSPEHGGKYKSSPNVEMLNLTSLNEAYFRYREITDDNRLDLPNPAEWSKNYTLNYGKGLFGLETGTWTSGEANFADSKEYEIEVFGVATNYTFPTSPDRGLPGTLLSSRIRFTVKNTDPLGLTPEFYRNVVIGVVALLALAFVGVIIYRRRVGAF